MTEQFRFPGLDPPRQVRTASARPEPCVWLRKLCVVRELQPGSDHIVRSIEMRLGLNILWAPPKQTEDGNALFRDAVAGHTAGKTTFCRLIRYVLGEQTFAADSTRRRIREKFPSGWVLGEVVVAGKLWTAARPFAVGAHPFAVPESTVQDVLDGNVERLDFQSFVNEIEAATVALLPARRFPATDNPVRWEHLLPWLTRDQECRFADVLEWRHSLASSGAPALNADDRQFLVRSVLGLISDEERTEQQRNAQLVTQKREAEKRQPLLAYQASVDHGRVENLLGIQLADPSSPLFASAARTEIARRRADLESRMAAFDVTDRRGNLQAALESAIEAEVNARREIEDAEEKLRWHEETLQQAKGETRKSAQVALLASIPPPRDYCAVPLTLARERGCPLATSRPIQIAEKRSERAAAEENANLERIVEATRDLLRTKRQSLAGLETSTRDARRTLMSAETAYDEQRGRLLEERAQLAQAERLVRDAEHAWNTSVEHAESVKRLETDIRASYDTQDELRREQRDALVRFSAIYDYVVRALLGDEVEGRIDTSGRSLVLAVEHHGERDSAALATVKLLGFDLAAMTQSIEGRGDFPRFLIHDGPREADMAPDIYERLFLYGQQLEECFTGKPSFQYIITTTAPPPEVLRREPWLLQPVLDASQAEGRLLGVDL